MIATMVIQSQLIYITSGPLIKTNILEFDMEVLRSKLISYDIFFYILAG